MTALQSPEPSTVVQARARGAAPLPVGFLVAGLALVLLAGALSVRMNGELRAWLDRQDAEVLARSQRTFDSLLAQRLAQLRSQVAVLAEDARIRSTVLTPQFDEVSTADVLAGLRKSAGADVLAILNVEGRVRSVTGADEMKNLDLSTSSLVQEGLRRPSAYVWTFTKKVRLLGVAPVQLGGQVLAMFMMGFDLESSSLADVGSTLGTTGGAVVGEVLVASSSKEEQAGELLRAAAGEAPGLHALRHHGNTWIAHSSRPSHAAGAVTVVWAVEKHHQAAEMGVLRWSAWAPVLLAGMGFLLLLALALRARAETATR